MGHEAVRRHFQGIARDYDKWKRKNSYYHSTLKSLFEGLIPPGKRVIEIGCATGDILASVNPARGVGIDPSAEMLVIASEKHPNLKFIRSSAETLKLDEKFDCVIMCDVVEHLSDIWETFEKARQVTSEGSRLIVSHLNPVWEPLLLFAEKLGLKMPEGPHSRIYRRDLINILELTGFDILETGHRLLLPKNVPVISALVNRVAERIPCMRHLCFVHYIVAAPTPSPKRKALSCSVIIPCHNEQENIAECVRRVPRLGERTEIIVVDDGSKDATAEVVRRLQAGMPEIRLISYGKRRGKGHAVRTGFDAATGDVLMVLDADMAVPPEELPRFVEPIIEGKAEAANGTRMVYPQEKQAMKQLHYAGNKMFSIIFTWLMGRYITDTLCGTKAVLKKDYRQMEMGRCPWGDFDILIGIAKLGLKMAEIPVHYKARRGGESKMRAFRHGLVLLERSLDGFMELKLRPLLKSMFGGGSHG